MLLVINLVAGFFMNGTGSLMGEMFGVRTIRFPEKYSQSGDAAGFVFRAHDWLKTHKHVHEFYILILSTLLGMFFMISSKNLMMFYVGLELASIPLAALVNFDLERRRSSEAALKMIMNVGIFFRTIIIWYILIVWHNRNT